MIDYLRRHLEFVAILISWVVMGVYVDDTAATILILLSLAIFKYRGFYTEMILGFIFILILSDNRDWSLAWTTSTKNLYLITLALFFLFDRKQFPIPNKFFIPFIPFLAFAFIMVYRNPQSMVSFQKVLSYFLLFTIAPPYLSKELSKRGHRFFRELTFFVLWLFVIGFIYAIVRPDLTYLVERYNGLLGNPNGVGILSTVFFIAFYIYQHKYPEAFSHQEKIACYLIIFISLVLGGSRTGMMSILIFLLFARFHKLSPLYSFAILIVVGLSYQFFTDNLTSILHSLGLEKSLRSETIESGAGRFVAWAFAWQHIQKNYLFGMGWDYDNQLYDSNQKMLNMLGHLGGVHNVFLGFWLCLGIVGVVLFYYAFFKTYISASRHNNLAFPFMYAVLFSTTFEAWLMGSLNPFTIFWILAFQIINKELNATTTEKSPVPVL